MTPIGAFVYVAIGYLVVGAVVGAAIVFAGSSRLDPRLSAAPIRVKLLLLPGAAAFWPLLTVRVFRSVS